MQTSMQVARSAEQIAPPTFNCCEREADTSRHMPIPRRLELLQRPHLDRHSLRLAPLGKRYCAEDKQCHADGVRVTDLLPAS